MTMSLFTHRVIFGSDKMGAEIGDVGDDVMCEGIGRGGWRGAVLRGSVHAFLVFGELECR